MPGPSPKQPGKRQRANKPSQMRVIPGGLVGRIVPEPPKGMLKVISQRWVDFWGSDLAQLVEPATDMMALHRLFTLYDDRERAYRSVKKKPFVKGSKGQPVANPMAGRTESLDKEIRMLEDRFGLTPKARLALGIAFGQMTKSLDDLNSSLDEDEDADGDEDPRVEIAQ